MSGFDITLKPMRRVEVINGAGGRRRWSADDKARILEETLVSGAAVSEVARRHGLLPQQIFGWRREARRVFDAGSAASPAFVPVIVEPPSSVVPHNSPKPPRRKRAAARSGGGIELELCGVVVRIGPDASPTTIAAVISALKCGS
ncbi:transposase (plasmid) [Aureimonas sp. SA4125]|uniref:IS66-like element accessory protein TnpA n=1 Tax=Aureimonas sp. SA4125 TaxID=2826993 RepID=UPI001CC6779C|nr:transposase [Aureimonas sp. SA4125]BDA82919.1 transposase [Aureimonas sp. SA4125]BDA83374.1 transposase [Aureimonas sp. SA4125]BDA83635.1 transposase [Aureimonas sp. SA4125]BDA84219.1 transposase [Aureimonas sp. SA4125]BDA84636.1 transposase [Aureimonas sp. SA4125]